MMLKYIFILSFFFFSCNNSHDIIKVPDFKGQHISCLDSLVLCHNLRYEIIDSVFDRSVQKGVVIRQDPLEDTDVKKRRKIYLTINAVNDRKVAFPDIFDLTLREGVMKIEQVGLKVGKLNYKIDIGVNKILDFELNGIPIKIGQELSYGTTIDLVVGREVEAKKIPLPDLVGLSRDKANFILKSSSLNIGKEYFDNSINESDLLFIYKQHPGILDVKKVDVGSSIDLYFNINHVKDSLK